MNVQETIALLLEHLRGMWRFRWWAAGIAWLLLGVGVAYVYTMPDVYQASTRVFVDTNSLLRPLMQGLTAQQDPLDELELVTVAVLSRPNLEEVAHDTDLALSVATSQEMEDLVTGLQNRIDLRRDRDNTYLITYQDTRRQQAVAVVDALLDAFVESAIGNEGEDAEVTERALASEIEDHESRLRAAEADLEQFKRENVGYMPDEAGDYYQRLQTAAAEVTKTEESIRLLQERRDELRRQLEGETPVFGVMSGPAGQAGCSQQTQITELETVVSNLTIQFTENHPRVDAAKDMIAVLKERCDAELESAAAAGLSPYVGESLETNTVYQNLRLMLSEAEVELASLRAELASRQARLERLQRDVDKIISVETELKQLNREYGVVQARHLELLSRWEDLQAARRLNPVTDPVKFRVIEPPFALAEPVGPNRPLLLAAVLVVVLGASVVVPYALNQLKPTFFTVESLRHAVDRPVLGAIGMLRSEQEIARQRIEKVVWISAYGLLFSATLLAVLFAASGSAALQRMIGS